VATYTNRKLEAADTVGTGNAGKEKTIRITDKVVNA